ncbi:DUF1496 domain-containing protein [Vibrio sp. SCSIO 43135]|uniref:DUF1496 domain-containing protein n=1 Tax=Vibrio sp. SCSIO 43135 TaxID=2819096 RepID=UPI002074DDBC|nr:DUF1496 domain-containing protein [Vibrio sp. SCSIO 43135]USD42166.1 DUF1496 domain-containing protein [Vibrio sp. SCSIO 43135]
MKRMTMAATALFSTVLSALPASAKIISTPSKPIVAVDGSAAAKRVCYYEDKAYSLGAMLQIGDNTIVCQEANDYETNGALRWFNLNAIDTSNTEISEPKDGSVKTYSLK